MLTTKDRLLALFLVVFLAVDFAAAEETPVRLRDGPGPNEGRVEIFKRGVWLSLCRRLVSGNVAEAVCTQLGYSQQGARMYYGNSYGAAPGETYRGSVSCYYSNTNLSSCSFEPETSTCDPQHALGVSCNTNLTNTANLRLVGGKTSFEGRVQVFLDGVWGTVADFNYETHDSGYVRQRNVRNAIAANVVCRLLHGEGYGGSAIPRQETALHFPFQNHTAILVQNIDCNGNETNIMECSRYNGDYLWNTAYDSYIMITHEDDLAVVCKQVPTGCNGYLTSVRGSLVSPAYPSSPVYKDDTDCVWKIDTTVSNAQILFTLSNISLLDSTSNSLQVLYYDGQSQTDLVRPTNYKFDQQQVFYIWLKASGTNGTIFKAEWNVGCSFTYSMTRGDYSIYSPGYGHGYLENLKCTYVYTYRKGLNATVSVNSLRLGGRSVDGSCSDFVEIFDGNSESSPKLGGPYCGTDHPTDLTSINTTSFAITVVFTSDDKTNTSADESGFYITFHITEPAAIHFGPYNASSGTLSTPGYPDVYNDEADIVWTITTKPYTTITLFFQDVQLQDYIYLSTSGSTYFSTDIYDGHVSPLILDTNSVQITLYSRYDNKRNRVQFNWTTECRQVMRSTQGKFSSPDDPEFDSSSAHCSYIISQSAGYYVSVLFTSVNLARDTQCRNFVKVFSGTNNYSPMVGHICSGFRSSEPFNSSENDLMVEFKTDGMKGTNNSFEASYSTHSKECGPRLITDSEGVLESPGFPLLFPLNTYCNWTITVQEGYVIAFQFKEFSIGQQGATCQKGIVRVYDGNTTDSDTVIGTYCGTNVPPTVHSSGNSLTVVLNAFSSADHGFTASYRAVSNANTSLDLLPYGPGIDKVFDITLSDTQEIILEKGFPFADDVVNHIYLGKNGIVSFKNSYPWPDLEPTRLAICVYCAYMKRSNTCRTGTSGVYYNIYNGTFPDQFNSLTKEFGSLMKPCFSPEIVLVFTWKCMEQDFQSSYKPDNVGQATFQLVLATDYVTSYAFTLYSLTEMDWKYYGQWYTIKIGIAQGSLENLQTNAYSNTEYANDIGRISGNTGSKGIWLYKIGEIPVGPDQKCDEWYLRNKKLQTARSEGFANLPQCPCNKNDIFNGVVNQWRYFRTDEDRQLDCFILNVAATRRYVPFSKECCYSFGKTFLNLSEPFAGPSLAHSPLVYELREQYETEDYQAYRTCCVYSTGDRCHNFYELRPIGECASNIPFRRGSTYGNTHIKTLDEREYSFNGIGEITLIMIRTPEVNFTLQGRTERTWDDKGVPSNGTVFTALGMEENGVRVFVGIDPSTNTSLVIYGNGTDYTNKFKEGGDFFTIDTEGFMISRVNNTCIVSFPSDIGIAVSVRLKALAIDFSIPKKFRGLTEGMLGNFNGNKSDDFVLPDGKILSDNLSDRQIFYNFSQKWLVTTENTVMQYEPRMGPADYYHPEFVPVFLDETLLTEQAVNICGAENKLCIYDYITTGKSDFALETSSLRNHSETTLNRIKNSLPWVEAPNHVIVKYNQTSQFLVTAHDDDNDVLTYHLADTYGGALKIDSSTGLVTALFATHDPVEISVFVVDSHGGQSPVVSIPLVLCTNCGGHGTCSQTETRPSPGGFVQGMANQSSIASNPLLLCTNCGTCSQTDTRPSTDRFYFRYAVCTCDSAWTGDECQVDRDGCADSPCHPLQNCTDVPAEKQGASDVGYTCSACPQGFVTYVSNGQEACLDVDECTNRSANTCEMLCENRYGSYACYCQPGYRLNTDGRTCSDINECLEKTSDCQQICQNIDGSYRCACEEGYIYNELKNICEEDHSIGDACQNSGCSQNCKVRRDPSTNSTVPECFCNSGFDLNPSDNKTCTDHDECQDNICAQQCQNAPGEFSCSCNNGYKLNEDKRTCSPCPYLRYGFECNQLCECGGREKDCDKVRGCLCQDGWTGSKCQDDVDECAQNRSICGPERVCTNTLGSYACSCRPGYTRDRQGNCTDINECAATFPCGPLENCANIPGNYYCSCIQGYTRAGSGCSDTNECEVSRGGCQQVCVNVPGSFNCECRYGYRLNSDRKTCSKIRDVCGVFNMSTCEKAHGCTLDDDDNPVCICDAGYELSADSQTCADIDECKLQQFNCSHSCRNTNGGFVCLCPVGMKLDDDHRTCIDCLPGTYGEECSQVCACGVGADRCDAKSGCVCQDGWQGNKCNQDINECENSSTALTCSRQNKICHNFDGGYSCKCRTGLAESLNGTCTDINECEEHPCDQLCINTVGSYRCECNSGFVLNQTTNRCDDEDECSTSVGKRCQQICQNTAGSYRCSCTNSGYHIDSDGATCVDINECTNGLARCTGICNNTDGSYSCSCLVGEKLQSDGYTCADCGTSCDTSCGCGQGAEYCDRQSGCTCKMGWKGKMCDEDVDECLQMQEATQNCTSQNATCVNQPGGYTCECPPGYSKNKDGACREKSLLWVEIPDYVVVTYNQTSQFLVTGHGKDSDVGLLTYHLADTYGGALKINSSTGSVTVLLATLDPVEIRVYVADSQGGQSPIVTIPLILCTTCGGHGTCSQTETRPSPGSYYFRYAVCTCDSAWTGDECQVDRDGCADSPCHRLQNCTDVPAVKQGASVIGFICSDCPQGFVTYGLDSCLDVDECDNHSTHNCEMLCENRYGSYVCHCMTGYRLNADGRTCSEE